MRNSKASAKTPAEANYSGDEQEYFNRLREHPYIPGPSHEGVAASPWRQEGALLPGYSWQQQQPPSALGSFNAPHYPPAEATNTRPYPTYQHPPAMTAADSLQAIIPLTHYTQAAIPLNRYHLPLNRYHQSRESMVYEQLMRTVAPASLHNVAAPAGSLVYEQLMRTVAPASLRNVAAPVSLVYEQLMRMVAPASLHNVAAPGSLRDLYSAPMAPQLPPWQLNPSVATNEFLPRLAPGSSNLLYTPGATAPDGQYFPPQHGSLSCPQQQGNEAVEAIALVEASMHPSDAEVNPREKRRQLTRASDPFPVRLFRLLSDLESSGEDQDIASFTASGHAFQILKPLEFMKEVAPRYFRQKHYSSFTRQLNCYGFHKVSHGPDKGAFCHPKFQRGKPELCKGIIAKVTEDYRSARVAEMHKLHSTNDSKLN